MSITINIIPAFQDNYIYLLARGDEAVAVDPGDAAPVEDALNRGSLRLGAMLLTHPHGDHTGGCGPLQRRHHSRVIGPAGTTGGEGRAVRGGEVLDVLGTPMHVLATPGHTARHVSFWFPEEALLCCGDTLFAGGCGRIMGSDAGTLWQSLLSLRELPDETAVYCGHEYTVDNLMFAAHLEPESVRVQERLADARARRASGLYTVPSRLGVEKATNPFLRADDPALAEAVGMAGAAPADVFAEIRRRKDRW